MYYLPPDERRQLAWKIARENPRFKTLKEAKDYVKGRKPSNPPRGEKQKFVIYPVSPTEEAIGKVISMGRQRIWIETLGGGSFPLEIAKTRPARKEDIEGKIRSLEYQIAISPIGYSRQVWTEDREKYQRWLDELASNPPRGENLSKKHLHGALVKNFNSTITIAADEAEERHLDPESVALESILIDAVPIAKEIGATPEEVRAWVFGMAKRTGYPLPDTAEVRKWRAWHVARYTPKRKNPPAPQSNPRLELAWKVARRNPPYTVRPTTSKAFVPMVKHLASLLKAGKTSQASRYRTMMGVEFGTGALPYAFTKEELDDPELLAKRAACISQVIAKMPKACLRGKKWGHVVSGTKCFNPWAVCRASVNPKEPTCPACAGPPKKNPLSRRELAWKIAEQNPQMMLSEFGGQSPPASTIKPEHRESVEEFNKRMREAQTKRPKGRMAIPEIVKKFMPPMQQEVVKEGLRGEEANYFEEILTKLESTLNTMPKLYQTEDQETEDKTVYLHYFYGGSDWYAVEKQVEDGEALIFGYAILNNDLQNAEWGYTSVTEIGETGKVELDFHWKPRPFKEVMAEKGIENPNNPSKAEARRRAAWHRARGRRSRVMMTGKRDWSAFVDGVRIQRVKVHVTAKPRAKVPIKPKERKVMPGKVKITKKKVVKGAPIPVKVHLETPKETLETEIEIPAAPPEQIAETIEQVEEKVIEAAEKVAASTPPEEGLSEAQLADEIVDALKKLVPVQNPI